MLADVFEMALNCFVCNKQDGGVEKTKINIFDTKSPISEKNLSQFLKEISGIEVTEENKKTNNLCAKCYKALLEYDYLSAKLNEMKSSIHNDIVRSEEIRKNQLKIKKEKKPDIEDIKVKPKLVLPASKLQPLPMWPLSTSITTKPTTKMPKVTVSKMLPISTFTTTLTKSVSTTSLVLPTQPTASTLSTLDTSTFPTLPTNKINNTLVTLPTILSTTISESILPTTASTLSSTLSQLSTTLPSTLSQLSTTLSSTLSQLSTTSIPSTLSSLPTTSLTTEVPIVLPNNITALFGKEGYSLNDFVIVREKDDENDDNPMEIDEDVVLMESEDGIISVMNKKFLYGNSEILVIPDDTDHQDEDGHDSNSEPHIELQVSGDEETAKAIIAAANEKGGTFIKVEGGEMYEVKSVESKIQEKTNTSEDPLRINDNMVEFKDDKFKCLFCERANKEYIDNADSMMDHLKNVHSARLYLCTCGAIIRKRVDYAEHVETHTNKNGLSFHALEKLSKTFPCEICKKKFSSRVLLSQHAAGHAGAARTCPLCDKTFATQYTLQAHMKTHSDRPRPFKCKKCNKRFFTYYNLNYHEKIHTATKDFICRTCNKAFSTQHNLEVHSIVHSGVKPFVCSVCDKGFARRAEIRDHMRIHTGERPFECEVCGAKFSQRSNLHSHRRATHLNDKRHHCPHCPKQFKRRRLLDYHIKGTHTGERPLVCELCGSTFVYPEHYKKHLRIHSGEKPFTCEVCGKGFNSRDNRNTHRFTHSNRKPYECVLCGAGYMRKQQLYQHMNNTGHISESIVVNQPRVVQLNENEELKTQTTVQDDTNKVLETVYEETPLQVMAKSEKDAQNESNETEYILSTDNKAISLVQGNEIQEGVPYITIENFESPDQIQMPTGVLENLTSEQLEQAHILSDGNNTVRLLQVQLADGGSGWVALSDHQ